MLDTPQARHHQILRALKDVSPLASLNMAWGELLRHSSGGCAMAYIWSGYSGILTGLNLRREARSVTCLTRWPEVAVNQSQQCSWYLGIPNNIDPARVPNRLEGDRCG